MPRPRGRRASARPSSARANLLLANPVGTEGRLPLLLFEKRNRFAARDRAAGRRGPNHATGLVGRADAHASATDRFVPGRRLDAEREVELAGLARRDVDLVDARTDRLRRREDLFGTAGTGQDDGHPPVGQGREAVEERHVGMRRGRLSSHQRVDLREDLVGTAPGRDRPGVVASVGVVVVVVVRFRLRVTAAADEG